MPSRVEQPIAKSKEINSANLMKTAVRNTLKALVGAILLSGVIVPTVSAESQAAVHSVTGSGLVHIPTDFFFPGSGSFYERFTISARQAPDGTVEGHLIVDAFSESRPVGHSMTVIDVNCLSVTGNTAYYGGVIVRTNDPFAAVGLTVIGYVTDANGAGPDLTWFGPAVLFLAPGQDCTAQPVMPQMPVASGNYVLR
jgi:hypothetical protein